MKKVLPVLLLCLAFLVGCANQSAAQEPIAQIGNPWTQWNSIEEAEAAAGFSFGLPAVVLDSYEALEIRTMNNQLIEVVYYDEEFEVCVRKQAGEGQDISGDYNEYELCTEDNYNGCTIITYQNSGDPALRQQLSYQGYSWSLVAPNGYRGAANGDFAHEIIK